MEQNFWLKFRPRSGDSSPEWTEANLGLGTWTSIRSSRPTGPIELSLGIGAEPNPEPLLAVVALDCYIMLDPGRLKIGPGIVPFGINDEPSENPGRRPIEPWGMPDHTFNEIYVWAKIPNLLLPLRREVVLDRHDKNDHFAWLCIRIVRNGGDPRLTHLGLAAGGDTKGIPFIKREQWWVFRGRTRLNYSDLKAALIDGRRPLEFKANARTLSVGIPRRPEVELLSWVELKTGLRSDEKLNARWAVVDGGKQPLQLQLSRRFVVDGPVSEPFLGGAFGATLEQIPDLDAGDSSSFGDNLRSVGWHIKSEWLCDAASEALKAGWNAAVPSERIYASRQPTALFRIRELVPLEVGRDPVLRWRAHIFANATTDWSGTREIEYLILFSSIEGAGMFRAELEFPMFRRRNETPLIAQAKIQVFDGVGEESLRCEILEVSVRESGWFGSGDIDIEFGGAVKSDAGRARILLWFQAGRLVSKVGPTTLVRWRLSNLNLPITQVRAASVSSTTAPWELEASESPLLIPLPNLPAGGRTNNTATSESSTGRLQMSEEGGFTAPTAYLTGSLAPEVYKKPSFTASIIQHTNDWPRTLVLDRSPFHVALVEIENTPETSGGNRPVASFSTNSLIPGWMFLASGEKITVFLPPQGLAETMEKGRGKDASGLVAYYDLEPEGYAQIRYSPATKLVFRGKDLNTEYGITPWNLRSALGELGRNRMVGLPLLEADIELLYGVQMRLREGRYLRVAELMARLGAPRGQLRDALGDEFSQSKGLGRHEGACAWEHMRDLHVTVRRLLSSRLAVHELFDERIEFSLLKREEQSGNDLILETDPKAAHNKLSAGLRTEAQEELAVSWNDKWRPWAGFEPLAGSFAWAFESKLLYDDLWKDPDPSTPYLIEATSAQLRQLRFSALGAWGQAEASFRGGLTKFAVRLEMGRIAELRIENHGRISVLWSRAKLVTIFRRSMAPPTQFGHQQDSHWGRAALRKAEEYVEFTQETRDFPDDSSSDASSPLAGPLLAIVARGRIPVDSRLGEDLGDLGWLVPLKIPPDALDTPAEAVYRRPREVRVRMPAIEGTVEGLLHDTEKLYFWTEAKSQTYVDSATGLVNIEQWEVLQGIDGPAPNEMKAFNDALKKVDRDEQSGVAKSIPPILQPFTFRIDLPAAAKVDLVGRKRTDNHLEVRLRHVTLFRGSKPKETNYKVPDSFSSISAHIESAINLLEELRPAEHGAELKNLNDALCKEIKDSCDAVKAQLNKNEKIADLSNGIVEGLDSAVKHAFRQVEGDMESAIENFLGSVLKPIREFVEAANSALEDKTNDKRIRQEVSRLVVTLIESRDRLDDELAWMIEQLNSHEAIHVAPGTLVHSLALLDSGFLNQIRSDLANVNGAGTMVRNLAARRLACWHYSWTKLGLRRWLRNMPASFWAGVDRMESALEGVLAAIPQGGGKLDDAINSSNCAINEIQLQLSDSSGALRKIHDALNKLVSVPEKASIPETPARTAAKKLKNAFDNLNPELMCKVEFWANALGSSLEEEIQKAIQSSSKELTDLASLLKNESNRIRNNYWDNKGELRVKEKEIRGIITELGVQVRQIDYVRKAYENQAQSLSDGACEKLTGLFRAKEQEITQKVAEARQWLNDKMAGVQRQADGVLRDVTADLVSRDETSAMTLGRALGEVPQVPMLNFSGMGKVRDMIGKDVKQMLENRLRSVAYDFRTELSSEAKRLEEAIKFTTVKQHVDRANAALGNAEQELKMKAASIERMVVGYRDKFKGDVEQMRKDLFNQGLGSAFPDFAGLKISTLLKSAVEGDFAEKIDKALNVTHGFDATARRGFVDAKLTDLQVPDCDIIRLGPIGVRLVKPRLNARIRTEGEPGGAVQRTESSSLRADWVVECMNRPVVSLTDTTLFSESGKVRFDFDPAKIKMDGVLQAIGDTLRQMSDDIEAAVPVKPDSRILTVGYDLAIPPQTLGAGSPVIVGLSLGLHFSLTLNLANIEKPFFAIRFGFNLASAKAPFAITFAFLGGGGYCEMAIVYEIPLAGGSPSLVTEFAIAISAAAATGFNLGPMQGSVMASLNFELRFIHGRGPGLDEERFSLSFVFVGSITCWGMFTVGLAIVLTLSYSGTAGLIGRGSVSVSFRVGPFFKLSYSTGFEKKLSGGTADYLPRPKRALSPDENRRYFAAENVPQLRLQGIPSRNFV